MGEQTLEFELLTCINMLNKKKKKKKRKLAVMLEMYTWLWQLPLCSVNLLKLAPTKTYP